MADAVPERANPKGKLFVAGSFQMADIRDPDQATSLVPATDGLHFIQPVKTEPSGTWCLLRIEGELAKTSVNALVFDDSATKMQLVMQYMDLT